MVREEGYFYESQVGLASQELEVRTALPSVSPEGSSPYRSLKSWPIYWEAVKNAAKITVLFDLYPGTKNAKHFQQAAILTRCMAELRGGCGSISNWDGVCPKFCICVSMACRGRRVTVIINMHQPERSTHSLTTQVYPKSAMKEVQKIHRALCSQGAESPKC